MLKIDLIQGSQEWLSYRMSKIMATDAGVILDVNPFKSLENLYEEKLGLTQNIKTNPAMQRGHDLEPVARELFSHNIGIEMTPCVCENNTNSWMAASLDGLSSCDKYILEIKCPNEDTHKLAINGQVKPYYYAQCQHQLAVTEAEILYYFSYRPEYTSNPFAVIEFIPDEKYIQNMIKLEKKFWFDLCQMTPPNPVWTFSEKK